MIDVKEIENGRFEVYAEDLHHEVFEGRLGAQLASLALATALAAESGESVIVEAPWGKRSIECPSGQPVTARLAGSTEGRDPLVGALSNSSSHGMCACASARAHPE